MCLDCARQQRIGRLCCWRYRPVQYHTTTPPALCNIEGRDGVPRPFRSVTLLSARRYPHVCPLTCNVLMTSSGPTVGNGWGDTASLGNIPGHVYGREVLRCYDWQAWVCSKLDEHGCTFKYARTHPLFIRCGKDCACQDGGKDKTKQCVACVWCTYAILGTCVHMRTDELAHTHARTPHTHAHTQTRARARTHT